MKGHAHLELFDSYSIRCFDRATGLIGDLPEREPPLYESAMNLHYRGIGTPDPLRCHEVARAVGEMLELQVQDGWYGNVDHTWLWVRNDRDHRGAILDVYAVGRLPMVQLVSLDSVIGHYRAGSSASLYRESRPRTDIRATIVQMLLERFRRLPEVGVIPSEAP